MRRVVLAGQELLVPVALVSMWWWLSASSGSLYFPPLSEIVDVFAGTWLFDEVGTVLVPTLRTFAAGYAISIVLGIAAGLLLAAGRKVADFVDPLLEFLRALPAIALVPVFVSVLGVGTTMQVSIVVFVSVWPILLNTFDGVRGIDLVARETASSFRVAPWHRLVRVTLPGASPQIVAGARVGLSLSLIAVIVTEMVTPSHGVGAFTKSAQMSFDLTAMWTAILLMGLVGYALNLLFVLLEKRMLRWHLRMSQAAGR